MLTGSIDSVEGKGSDTGNGETGSLHDGAWGHAVALHGDVVVTDGGSEVSLDDTLVDAMLLVEVCCILLHEDGGAAHFSDFTTSSSTGAGNLWVGGLTDEGPVEEVSECDSHLLNGIHGNGDLELISDLDSVLVSINTLWNFDTELL